MKQSTSNESKNASIHTIPLFLRTLYVRALVIFYKVGVSTPKKSYKA